MAGIINKGFTKVSDLTLGNELTVNIPLGSTKPSTQDSDNLESEIDENKDKKNSKSQPEDNRVPRN